MEGSLWVYGGQTDLRDLYRDRLTLRQVWVRLTTLPHEAPSWRVIEKWEAEAKEAKTQRDVEDVLAMVRRQ